MLAARVKLLTSSGAAHPSRGANAPVWTANSEIALKETVKAKAAMASTSPDTTARNLGSFTNIFSLHSGE
jgi:hypothetical protein